MIELWSVTQCYNVTPACRLSPVVPYHHSGASKTEIDQHGMHQPGGLAYIHMHAFASHFSCRFYNCCPFLFLLGPSSTAIINIHWSDSDCQVSLPCAGHDHKGRGGQLCLTGRGPPNHHCFQVPEPARVKICIVVHVCVEWQARFESPDTCFARMTALPFLPHPAAAAVILPPFLLKVVQ